MSYKRKFKTRELILCAFFASLIAVGAFIRIPVPIVPFTLQFLFVNLAGLLLGRRLGAVSVLVYILIGLLGLPVFSSGGGLGYVFHPTFGYLIGFCVGSYVAGYIVEKINMPEFKSYFMASLANICIVYLFGVIYYYVIANYYLNSSLAAGVLILHGVILCLPGDLLICFWSSLLAKRLRPFVFKGESLYVNK